MSRDSVDIRIRLAGAKKAAGEVKVLGHEINDLGDEAGKAARKFLALNAASSRTRVNVGFISTSARGGVLAVGALALGVQKLTPQVLSLAEATAVLTGGGAAAGAHGLLAIAQGSVVARLGLSGLMDALGGNEKAAKDLAPELQDLFTTLHDHQDKLKQTAQDGLVPGLEKGTHAALHNFGALNKIVAITAKHLGGLAEDAGGWLGRKDVGRDAVTIGRANAHVIDDLGHAGLNLADAFRHILVEAGPLTEWMASSIEHGTELADTWALNARKSGDMAKFFREARTDLKLLASIGGHGGRGIINLFGSQDVDGTRTLRSLDHITARFEDWTSSPAVQDNLGKAIVDEIPDAVAAAMDAIAHNLPMMGGTAAKVFWEAFWHESLGGKALTAAVVAGKFGAFKKLGNMIGAQTKGGKETAALLQRGSTPANPLYVFDVTNGLPGHGPGGGSKDPVVARGSTAAERQATKDWVNGRGSRVGRAAKLGRGAARAGEAGLGLLSGPVGWALLGGDTASTLLTGHSLFDPGNPLFKGSPRPGSWGANGPVNSPSSVSHEGTNALIHGGPVNKSGTDALRHGFFTPIEINLVVAGRTLAKVSQEEVARQRARGSR